MCSTGFADVRNVHSAASGLDRAVGPAGTPVGPMRAAISGCARLPMSIWADRGCRTYGRRARRVLVRAGHAVLGAV